MPRTEQEILKDFEEWGWDVVVNDEDTLELVRMVDFLDVSLKIRIYKLGQLIEKIQLHKTKKFKFFSKKEARAGAFDIDEMKLILELIRYWGWLDE